MGKVLLRLSPAESAFVLRSLLKHHPDLVAEAEEVATALVTHVDADAVAENVEKAVLDLDILDLDGRAGRQSWGYVEPSEAAWETLGEAIDPFVDGMRRCIELGFHAPATAICAGVVCGLYRCRGRGSDRLLGWAEDFPEETAAQAVATLAEESAAKHRRVWRLPAEVVGRVPEWEEMIGRCSTPASRRRRRRLEPSSRRRKA